MNTVKDARAYLIENSHISDNFTSSHEILLTLSSEDKNNTENNSELDDVIDKTFVENRGKTLAFFLRNNSHAF